MKLKLYFLFGTLFIFTPILWAKDLEVITITGHPDYPPIIWYSEKDHQLQGVAVELIKKIFPENEYKLKFIPLDTWGRALKETTDGRIDILLPPYKTTDRLELYDYPDKAFALDRTKLFLQKGKNITFKSLKDLKKYQGVALLNDSFGDEFDEYSKKELKIIRLSKTSQALKFLSLGRADYVIAGYNAGIAVAAKENLMNKIDIHPKSVIETGLYFGVSKKTKLDRLKLIKLMNDYLKDLPEEEVIQIEKKYMKIFLKSL